MSGEALLPRWRWTLASIPLLILALLAGTIVVVGNPGLFWDDWVWIHQEPAEHIRISKELGIWWAGHLSNAIYATKEPVLLLRIVSLIAWAIAAAAMAYTFWINRWLTTVEAILLAALMLAAHVPIVRFLTSVAMYNVYIASFWLGCAVLATAPRNQLARLLAAFFFFFSFHLNSLLVMHGLVLLWLFVPHARVAWTAASEAEPEKLAGPWRSIDGMKGRLSIASQAFWPALSIFFRREWLFVAVPFVFYAVIKLTSLLLSTVLASQQRIYSDYNSVQIERLVREVFSLPRVFIGNIIRYFLLAVMAVPARLLVAAVILGALLACLLPFRGSLPSIRKSLLLIGGGFVLFSFGVYPYLIVAKPPVLFDFHEARNIMPALGGLLLATLGMVNLVFALAGRIFGTWSGLFRNAAIGALVGLGVAGQFILGTDLAKDWFRQVAIASYAKTNKDVLGRYGTFLFVDKTTGFRINNRKIWNYEYTGNMVDVFGAKTKLGISLEEYESWPRRVPLLSDPVFRRRYNLTNHDHALPQAIIEITNGESYPLLGDVIHVLGAYWRGKPIDEAVSRFFVFGLSEQLIEADANVAAMRAMVASLENFKREVGVYPYTTVLPPNLSNDRSLAVRLPGQRSIPAYLNELPRGTVRHGFVCTNADQLSSYATRKPELDLTGPSIERCKLAPRCFNANCGFLFMSDGVDYKLVYINPVDRQYAQQAFGHLMDPVRDAYGFWTPAAARW